ncbi:type IIL restriction-modification enzyme MmeI, partial [uncultured Deinococcus sp.]|uniref:type IIL restriction-modification enzyme MmeI n=1 Tax=uncultured Deinococcus sp. TaxID=158789 RepID=UPI00345BD4F4
ARRKSSHPMLHIYAWISNGRDLMSRTRGKYVIDFHGLPEEGVRSEFPALYQHLRNHVYDLRQQNNNALFRELWWVLGHSRPVFRAFTAGLTRYVVTLETAKHQVFQFIDASVVPDSTLVTFGFEDAYHLGVLSSRHHVVWSLAQGSRLGVGNDPRYNKTTCFETFPFPYATPEQQGQIRESAQALDDHRKARQEIHPALTLTGMYNVLAKLRSGEPLDAAEQKIHDQGLITVLRELHDRLDEAVAAAYGTASRPSDQDILATLASLNAARAAEERAGTVRYLRPEYQDPGRRVQEGLGIAVPPTVPKVAALQPFPTSLPAQVQAVRQRLQQAGQPLTSREVALAFTGARPSQVEEIIATLVMLGQARLTTTGAADVRYAA